MYQEYGFTAPEQLEAAVDTAYQEMRQTSGELKALETKLQGKKELQQQVLAYAKTKPARDGLKAQKTEKARSVYRERHESDFKMCIRDSLNKAAGTQSTYRGLGSIDITAAVRSLLFIGKLKDSPTTRVLIHEKSSLAPPGQLSLIHIWLLL